MKPGPRGRWLLLAVTLAVIVGIGGIVAPTLWVHRPVNLATATPASPAFSSDATATRTDEATNPDRTSVVHLVGLGDSVMSGMNCSCRGIVAEYADRIASDTGQKVVGTNLGVPGATTQDLLADLREDPDTQAAVRNADRVVVTIGANDLSNAFDTWQDGDCDATCYGPDVAGMKRRLDEILARITELNGAKKATVLVTNYWNVYTDGTVARGAGGQPQLDFSAEVTHAVNAAIAEAVHNHPATLVDLVEPFKGSSGTSDPTRLLADDGDHPNAAGVQTIVASLSEAYP